MRYLRKTGTDAERDQREGREGGGRERRCRGSSKGRRRKLSVLAHKFILPSARSTDGRTPSGAARSGGDSRAASFLPSGGRVSATGRFYLRQLRLDRASSPGGPAKEREASHMENRATGERFEISIYRT